MAFTVATLGKTGRISAPHQPEEARGYRLRPETGCTNVEGCPKERQPQASGRARVVKTENSIMEAAMRKQPRSWMFTPLEGRLLLVMLGILLTTALALITRQHLP
jgi:hypothetical protein